MAGCCQEITPDQLTSYVGGSATFRCRVSIGDSARNITWTKNNRQIGDSTDNVMIIFDPLTAGGIGSITFVMLSASCNNSEVQCTVHTIGGNEITSEVSLLLVLQGVFDS